MRCGTSLPFAVAFFSVLGVPFVQPMTAGAEATVDYWQIAQQNSQHSQRAVRFCYRYANAWLQFADPTTGLLPRRLDGFEWHYWNAKDCAADNYPFLTLVAHITNNYSLRLISRHILEQERKLTARVDSMTDDFDFATQTFKTATPNLPDVIFGAAEYIKDGLIPITEWLGPTPWSRRAEELLRDIWKHAEVDSPLGKVPSDSIEVDGDLLQAMSRLYWMTGDDRYKDWAFKIADLYITHKPLLDLPILALRDHGCEIIGGLSEVYVIAAHKDQKRHATYKPVIHALLDFISRHGLNEDGMMHIRVDTKTGQPTQPGINDGFGYVLNAFLTVADIDSEPRFREPVIHTLSNIKNVELEKMEGIAGPAMADQLADSLEGAINLLNRIPISSAFDWVDRKMEVLFSQQRPDGIIEAWYGDGNSARTAMMYALYKTQGITAAPWRDDIQLGASRDCDGVIRVFLRSDYPWSGRLRFDRPRHRDYLHLPLDYARINQFPEWFTVKAELTYSMTTNGEPAKLVNGKELFDWPLKLSPGTPMLLTIRTSSR